MHTDVEGLRALVELPSGIQHARWFTGTRGDGRLGPSDYSLAAYVELTPAGWNALTCDGGAPGSPHPLLIDGDTARALLPANVVVRLSLVQGQFNVPSVPLPPECVGIRSPLRVGSLERIGDGLWIDAFTM